MLKLVIYCLVIVACNGARFKRQLNDPSTDEEMCKSMVGNATKCEKPMVMFLGGGVSAGKGALKDKWLPVMQKEGCNFFRIDSDTIKTVMKEWKKDDKCIANKLHEASIRIAHTCYNWAITQGYNIVYEDTMFGFREAYNRVQKAEEHGYTVQMFSVTVDTPEAAKRSINSAKDNGQYVPLCRLVESHARFSANYRTYLAIIPTNYLYDTFSKTPKLIVENNRVLDKEKFDTFLKKSEETMETVMQKLEPNVKEQYEKFHAECDDPCKPEEEVWLSEKDQRICKILYRDAQTCEKPKAVYIGGGTAAGKSTVAHEVVFKDSSCGYARIDTDVVMTEMTDWQKLTTGDKAKCAGNELFKKASTIAYRCYLQALEQGLNVVYDGTYSNFNMTVERIQAAQQRGYDTYLFGVTTKTSTAAERAWKSAEKTKQYVPLCTIVQNHAGFSRNYADMANFMKRNKLYDNNGDAKVIMENGKVMDETAVKEFRAKSEDTVEKVMEQMDKTTVEEYKKFHELCNVCKP